MSIEIVNHQGYYVVLWPKYNNIRDIDPKLRLLDTLFGKLNLYTIGLVETNWLTTKDPYWLTWINVEIWAQDKSGVYAQWVERTFKITGIAFKEIQSAVQFKDILEKTIVWTELKK
jgi:hypothetical protein